MAFRMLAFYSGSPQPKKTEAEEVDACVSAEVPDPEVDPHLHAVVCAKMVHGSPCLKDGRCKVGYPKPYQEATPMP